MGALCEQVIAMAVGVLVCYAFGTAWFMLLSGNGLWQSLMWCVIPFLLGDAVKIILRRCCRCGCMSR